MKPIRNRKLFASFVIAILLLLNIPPALAGSQLATSGGKGKFRGRVEVIFTKSVTNFPNMAGVVSGDAGAGLFAGEVLNVKLTTNGDIIDALYHINGGAFQFTAHNYVTEDFLTGTAVIRGVVTDGPMKGAQVRGQYQIISPCGVINAQKGDGGDFCYQGTLTIGSGSQGQD
ncbi:MAG: hypothetical protein JWQ49_1093 [Edaphobacter sp.]|nr:hypothetical protein [Edaphobacter sp.]